jgi:hypothetical protein
MFARSHATFVMIALGAAATTLFGCGGAGGAKDTGSTDAEDIASIEAALETENGGMNDAKEKPGFGDEDVLTVSELDDQFADQRDLTADVAAQSGASKYHVLVLWGNLPRARDQQDTDVEPTPLDWSGSISVADGGALGLKRTLAFDDKDSVAERAAPNSIAFISHTQPAVDGMLLEVGIPSGGAKTLHFATETLTADIDLSQLSDKGGGVVPLDDKRHGLAFIGFEAVPGVKRGFILGRWVKIQGGLGKLRGRVIGGDGEEVGHVKGIWGHAPRKDANVFFGKFINAAGDFRALFGGKYGDGNLSGRWATADRDNVGVLEGRYFDGRDEADGRGAWLARWTEKVAQ